MTLWIKTFFSWQEILCNRHIRNSIVQSTRYIINKKDIEPQLSEISAEILRLIKFAFLPPKDKKYLLISYIKCWETQDSIQQHYFKKQPKAFKGIATLKNYEVNIHLNPSVKPVAKHPRMIPCHQHVAGHPRTIP